MDADHLQAIGRLTVAAGQVEMSTLVFARLLMGGDFKVVKAVVSGMQFEQMTNLVKRLSDRCSGQTLEQLREWSREARAFMGERNGVLHTTWGLEWSGPAGVQANGLRIKTMRGIYLEASDINAIAVHGEELVARAQLIAVQVHDSFSEA